MVTGSGSPQFTGGFCGTPGYEAEQAGGEITALAGTVDGIADGLGAAAAVEWDSAAADIFRDRVGDRQAQLRGAASQLRGAAATARTHAEAVHTAELAEGGL
jgi:hypothetical protein